jgi:hypothetical protein
MQGFEIKFNVYANDQNEADNARNAIVSFINNMAQQGYAVTGNKIVNAINRWGNNPLIKNYFV